ncbi:hypothetical protein C7271_12700 [filamentous cyanobacterium CCP5]|nr:hypothetical protein C7271_12700 [filamentous cyanobacterium CCP5]
MHSDEWAQYIEATEGISKPWLLLQWRLQKLQERSDRMAPEDYATAIAELHQELMALGEWWVGREAEVFGLRNDANDSR